MSSRTGRVSIYLLLVFSAVGIFSMTYLALSFSANLIPQNSCSVSGTILDCGKVVTSQYSKLFLGINNYYLGAAFFAVIMALALYLGYRSDNPERKKYLLYVILILAIAGSALSVYLIYLELFVIGAVCILCTAGHVSIFAILVVSAITLYNKRHGHPKNL